MSAAADLPPDLQLPPDVATTTEALHPSQVPSQAARVDQILTWILEGNTEFLIRQEIAGTWPDADPQTLIAAAIQQLFTAGKWTPAVLRGFCYKATLHIYQKVIAEGDFPSALRALKQLADFADRGVTEIPADVPDQRAATITDDSNSHVAITEPDKPDRKPRIVRRKKNPQRSPRKKAKRRSPRNLPAAAGAEPEAKGESSA